MYVSTYVCYVGIEEQEREREKAEQDMTNKQILTGKHHTIHHESMGPRTVFS